MTVQSKTSKAVYVADGQTTSFTIPFYFLDHQIAVYEGISTTPLTENTDYTLTGAGNNSGGSVEFTSAPDNGTVITIMRQVDLTQLITFIEGEKFPASDYEYGLDKITMALQQLSAYLDNCVSIPVGASLSPNELFQFIVAVDTHLQEIINVPELAAAVAETYQTIQGILNQYYTKTESDGRYYPKSDVYTKTESDGKYYPKTDVYTKTESDSKYYTKSDVYTKTESDGLYYNKTDADTRYYTKSDVYTKTEADNKYYAKSDVYTKTEADGRYYQKSDVYTKTETGNLYYTKTDADGRYYQKSDVYTKTEVNALQPIIATDITVAVSGIVADATYADYPYKLDVPVTGATADKLPQVILGAADASSGIYAPVALSYSGGVRLYLKEIPDAANVQIPAILLH